MIDVQEAILTNLGSTAKNPGPDWSQLKETVSLLCLTMAQIESSRTDSIKSIENLMRSFVNITEQSAAITQACNELNTNDEADQFSSQKQRLAGHAQNIESEISTAVIAMQYHDRMTQKLEHVTATLNHLGELINDDARAINPDEWVKLQNEIKGHYTLACEQLLFDLIMGGSSLKEALHSYHSQYDQLYAPTSVEADDDVEFF